MTTPDDAATIVQRHERHVETPHGRAYATEVPGEDPPIVLMHGFPDDHRIYGCGTEAAGCTGGLR
jgi:pimeloyl-ACP methyl ester carboxylesterase